MTVKSAHLLDTAESRMANGLSRGLILSADLVAQRAQRKARVKTGRMKRNITRGNPRLTNKGGYIDVGGNLVYLPVHEFGSQKRNISAQPMLRPALEESKEEIKVILVRSVIGALKGR